MRPMPISRRRLSLMTKHRALEDTIKRARHYGAIAKDALAFFPGFDHEGRAGRGCGFLDRADDVAFS